MEDVNKHKRTNLDAVTLGKAASILDLTLDLSWLLDQSTVDFLLSNWRPFWAHVNMKSWFNKVSEIQN